MLILDTDFKQLIALRKLVHDTFDIQVDTCYSFEVAKRNIANHSYQYLMLNATQFDLSSILQWVKSNLFGGKVIFFNSVGAVESQPSSNTFYLDGLPKKNVLNGLITTNKVNPRKSFNEREILQKALNSPDTIKFLFQAQYNKQTSHLYGFELFTRFSLDSVTLPTRKIISGIEEYGLMAKFCYLFFNKLAACLDSFSDIRLSINLSLNDIEKLEIAQLLADCLEKVHMDASKITVEINEIDFVSMSDRAIVTLVKIHELGCDICVEGVKSAWKNLPSNYELVSEIKIPVDSFLLNRTEWDSLILQSFGKEIRLVITNIENAEQLQVLQSLPNNFILQGYFLSHPQDYITTLNLTHEPESY